MEFVGSLCGVTRAAIEQEGFTHVERWTAAQLTSWVRALDDGRHAPLAPCFRGMSGKMFSIEWIGHVVKRVVAQGGDEAAAHRIYEAFHHLHRAAKLEARGGRQRQLVYEPFHNGLATQPQAACEERSTPAPAASQESSTPTPAAPEERSVDAPAAPEESSVDAPAAADVMPAGGVASDSPQSGLTCSACGQSKPKASYSKAQQRKNASQRRCADCVAEPVVEQLATSKAAAAQAEDPPSSAAATMVLDEEKPSVVRPTDWHGPLVRPGQAIATSSLHTLHVRAVERLLACFTATFPDRQLDLAALRASQQVHQGGFCGLPRLVQPLMTAVRFLVTKLPYTACEQNHTAVMPPEGELSPLLLSFATNATARFVVEHRAPSANNESHATAFHAAATRAKRDTRVLLFG
eukprot:4742620-Prymnesium_polylepis.1